MDIKNIKVRIDKQGDIHAVPVGTEGEECLALLSLFDRLNGIEEISCEYNEDMDKEKDVQLATYQNV